jgi:hypothetical protein
MWRSELMVSLVRSPAGIMQCVLGSVLGASRYNFVYPSTVWMYISV